MKVESLPNRVLAGIHSSTIFSRLQFHGKTSSAFNEIPKARFSFEPDLKELTVLTTNDETYTIHPNDYEMVARFSKGTYNITRCEDGTVCDLEITETILNTDINDAVHFVNDVIRRLYSTNGSMSKQRKKWLGLGRPGRTAVFSFIDAVSKLWRASSIDVVALNTHCLPPDGDSSAMIY